MAVYLHVEEYQTEAPTNFPTMGDMVADQRVAIAAASAASSAFNALTKWVVLTAQTPCQVEFGTAPTAAGGSWYLPADVPRAYPVALGQSWKVAVIQVQTS